jgi:hypothetical protein
MTILLLCASAYAQAGSEINPTIHLLTNQQGVDVEHAEITFEAARILVAQEFGAQRANDSSFYCMIHMLRWKSVGALAKAEDKTPAARQLPVIDLQNWYTYNVNEKDSFKGVRIYGSKNVGFLYVHVNALGSNTLTPAASAKLATDNFITSDMSRPGVAVDSGVVIKGYTLFNYTWEEKPKLPKIAADAKALLGLIAQGAANPDFKEQPVMLYGSSVKNPLPLKYKTSDLTVKMIQYIDQGAGQVDTNQISAQTYDNEGRARFDLSLGVPVTRVKELSFNASDNTVRSSKTDRQHLYAFMNIFLKPIDTKGLKVNSTPHLMFGLPITGKPLDSPFVGGGYGFNKIQVFAGVVFNRERRPSTLSTGAAATQGQLESDLRPKYKPKFMMGLNFPVKQIVDALSSKK